MAETTGNGKPHLLETEQIAKYYGNIVALKDISAHVDAGEVTCILGDNGAGKSSFIKILSGVHQHDEGRLLVDGNEVHFASRGLPNWVGSPSTSSSPSSC